MDHFNDWIAALEARHLAQLTFPEVSRALKSLSATYVERRRRIGEGAALSGAGKRAAFALFYGPLHFLLVREIVTSLPGVNDATGQRTAASTLVDLGCGTGAAGAAWAGACARSPRILGIDRHPWAVKEAAATYREFGLPARTSVGDAATADFPGGRLDMVVAFTLNELPDAARERLLGRLVDRAAQGDRVLIVEPLAGFVAPWWTRWRAAVEATGGRADEWRVRVELPVIVAKLDRAAGLNHREITGRSLWIPGRAETAVRSKRRAMVRP
jgi:SAM-dependent methyltransferase